MKYGLNKKLYLRRKELHLSNAEAAIKIGISKLELYLIERGYVGVRESLKEQIIFVYQLDNDFFNDDFGYPEEIDAVKRTQADDWVHKISLFLSKKLTKFISFIIGCGFLAMMICGVRISDNAAYNTQSYFTDQILETRQAIIDKGIKGYSIYDSEFVILTLDSYYTYTNENITDRTMDVSINYFSRIENVAYSFLKGDKDYKGELGEYHVHFEARVNEKAYRVKMLITSGLQQIGWVAADLTENSLNYYQVYGINYDGEVKQLDKYDPLFTLYTALYDIEIVDFCDNFKAFFAKDSYLKARYTFESYTTEYGSCVVAYNNDFAFGGSLEIYGLIFGLIFFAIAFTFISEQKLIADRLQIDLEDTFADAPKESISGKKIKKNWKLQPILPEFILKLGAIFLLFAGSIGLYFIFSKAINLDIRGLLEWIDIESIYSSLSAIGLIILFFIKLDVNQNKKSMFLANYGLFFLGLGYYFLLLMINDSFLSSHSAIAYLGQFILEKIPGNSVWGILSFNLLVMFLFYKPIKYDGHKNKMLLYRLGSLIPLSYLIASCVLTFVKKNGVNIPFEVYSLFFSKSFYLVLFAVLFVYIIFFYKRYIVRKYGKEQSDIYFTGNKYYFTKNIVAALIVLAIGICETTLYKVAPDNVYKFGKDSLILFAIPFILLYHPHIGKRNFAWDTLMSVMNAVSLFIGIVLIAVTCMGGLLNI